MKRIAATLIALSLIGLTLAQPPRKEEEDPASKGKTPAPIDIDSFPDPKDPKNPFKSTQQKPNETKTPDGPGVPPGKGTLVVGVRHLPVRMSPSKAHFDSERWALDLIFEGLMRPALLDGGTTLAPGLAVGPPRGEAGGRSFTIDPAATWTDAKNTPVDANDVIATLRRLREAGDDSLGDAFADSKRRLRLTFRATHPDPVAFCTFKVLPANRAEDEEFARHPVGSGPFIYTGNVTEGRREYAVFKANPNYNQRAGHTNRPLLREVRFMAGTEPLADFRRGTVDVVLEECTQALAAATPPSERRDDAGAKLESGLGGDARLVTRPTRRIYYLAINPLKTALGGDAGKNLRRAIAMGIDREKILSEVWRQPGQPFHKALTGPFPAGTWCCDNEAGTLDDEPLARAELRSAKLPPGKLELVFPSDDPLAAKAAPMLADQLTAFGVPTMAKGLADADYRKTVIADKSFDLAWRQFEYRDDWFDPAPLFAANNAGLTGFSNDGRIEGGLARCAARCEFASLRVARRQFHREFREIMPFVPLWNTDMHIVLRRTVETAPAPDHLDPQQPFVEIERWRVNR